MTLITRKFYDKKYKIGCVYIRQKKEGCERQEGLRQKVSLKMTWYCNCQPAFALTYKKGMWWESQCYVKILIHLKKHDRAQKIWRQNSSHNCPHFQLLVF